MTQVFSFWVCPQNSRKQELRQVFARPRSEQQHLQQLKCGGNPEARQRVKGRTHRGPRTQWSITQPRKGRPF